jgi:hypothetical protein
MTLGVPKDYCKEFGELMSKQFEMSIIRELTFFLGFKTSKSEKGFFSLKISIPMIFSRNSRWMIASRSRHLCHPMDIST